MLFSLGPREIGMTISSPPLESIPAAPEKDRSLLWRQVAPVALLFLAACWVFFSRLGAHPLFNPDEALYAEPAREMLEVGEYLTTLLNYDVRFTKPPLTIWAMALFYKAFGVNEFAARFLGAACGAVLVAASQCFVARYAGIRAGFLAGLSLLVAPLFVGTGRMAITDMPLSLFIAGAMMCFYRGYVDGSHFLRWLAYILVGLAVMTKGPVAVVLPVMILLAFHLLAGDLRQALRYYRPLSGALVVGAIALPWFVAEIAVTRGAYFQEFIVRENFQRYTSVVDSHKGGWWYHLAAMFGGFFPFSVFLPQALRRAVCPYGALTGVGLKRLLSRYRNLQREESLLLYCAVWAAVTLVFFSASVSKLLPYTVPAFPAIAALVGLELDYICRCRSIRRLAVPLALLAIIYGGAAVIGPHFLNKLRNAPADLFAILSAFVAFQGLNSAACVLLAVLRRPAAAIFVFGVLTLSSSAFFGARALDALARQWEAPLPAMAEYASLSGLPLIVFDMRKPGIPFYARRKVIQPGGETPLIEELSRHERAYVLTKAKRRGYFASMPGARIVRVDGAFILVAWSRPAH